MVTPELQTDRLLLRPIKIDDMEYIYDCWMQDEDVSRYMCWKASTDLNQTKKFVQFELDNLEKDDWNRWIVTLSQTGEIIGTCLIFFNTDEHNWDISYNLGKKHWGQGYISRQ